MVSTSGTVQTCIPIEVERSPIELHTNPETSVPSNAEICPCPIAKCTLVESRLPLCRICYSADNLIAPCNCKGTVATVHRQCLEHWLNESATTCCDLCAYQFATESQLRYGWWESVRIWAKHPRTAFLFRYDMLIFLLINLCVIALTVMVTIRMSQHLDNSFSESKMKWEQQSDSMFTATFYWTTAVHLIFGSMLLLIFVGNINFLFNAQIIPWYRWWRRQRRITIIPSSKDQISSCDC